MQVYVGATFSRYEEARRVIDALAAAGHSCAHDWTRTRAFGADGHPLPDTGGGYELDPEDAAAHATDDVRAVTGADACLFLGEQPSLGWPTEFGIAIATGCPRIVVVAPFRWTVFLALPAVEVVETIDAALELFGAVVPS